jgi:arylsulfatase A-like enzyme
MRPSSKSWWPRLEHVLLAVAFLCNTYGKYIVLSRTTGNGGWADVPLALASDLVFFGCLLAAFAILQCLTPAKVACRIRLLVALLVTAWSTANLAWLIATGAQIHINVIAALFRNPGEFGTIVTDRLSKTPSFTIPLLIAGVFFAAAISWKLVRPNLSHTRSRWRQFGPALLGSAAVLSGLYLARSGSNSDPRRQALAFSSHWFAISSLFGFDGSSLPDENGVLRRPREGERIIDRPERSARPHIVMIVMESTAWWSTTMGGQLPSQTPTLAELAARGVLFEQTRAVVTHTTQSLFSVFTGSPPSPNGGYVEAVPVDRPYESLPKILKRFGYRSRFCQMVRATFECRPGLVANLGFDDFWAREDARDPASHLGYFGGDDFKMIGPAFDWLDRQDGPALLVFMTSVAHHPYETPAWFGPAEADERQAYLKCVRYTDAFVAEVVAQLQRRDIFDNTLLCALGDHGEGMLDHGIRQHNENPLDEALRVPWIVTWPQTVKAGKRVSGNCSLLDVTPTLLSMLGCDVSRAGFDGLDAFALIGTDRRTWFAGWFANSPLGFVQGPDKQVFWPGLGTAYRYDLAADPDERQPQLLEGPARDELARELSERHSRYRIGFKSKRSRQRRLFARWETIALGDAAWCYYVDSDSARQP